MLEFAYLLHRRRNAERRSDCKKSKLLPKEETIETLEEESLRCSRNKEENMECNMFQRRQHQIMEVNSKKMEKQQFWTKSHIIRFKCCTLNIDLFSQWLFLSMFILFNILYWFHYLRLFHVLGIIY